MLKTFLLKNKKWIIALFFLLIFIFIAEDLLDNELNHLDSSIYNLIKVIISPKLTPIFKFITNIVSFKVLVIFCLFSYLLFKEKKYSIQIIINLIGTMTLNLILKLIFSRPRPLSIELIDESGYSFPSGHSMIAMSFFGFFIYLLWKSNYSKKVKYIITILLGLTILVIGISRIYLGVHYASDIIAGFSISIIYLIIFTHFIFNHKKNTVY